MKVLFAALSATAYRLFRNNGHQLKILLLTRKWTPLFRQVLVSMDVKYVRLFYPLVQLIKRSRWIQTYSPSICLSRLWKGRKKHECGSEKNCSNTQTNSRRNLESHY